MSKSAGSIHILSQGCSANFGEGEQIAGLLQQQGYQVSLQPWPTPQDPQTHPETSPLALVLNLCTVKGNGSALQLIRQAREQNTHTPLVVTGCVTTDLVRELRRSDPSISIATTNNLSQVPQLVQDALQGQQRENLSRLRADKAFLPRVQRNPVIGIVPVSNGCLDACTFCSTRLVKGRHYSYPAQDLIQDIDQLIHHGCQEIWLAGQDASCWGFDQNSNLARLVRQVLDTIPGHYRIRMGMGNPRHLLSYWEEFADLYQDPRLFRFLHLPVQSGSSRILQSMGRRHSADDYRMLVEAFRNRIPDLTLSTDIIVGFPGESEQDFEDTMNLLKETQPSVVNRTRYVVRPGTPAAHFPQQVHKEIKKDRSRRLTDLVKSISLDHHQKLVHQTFDVIVDEKGKQTATHPQENWIARTDTYRQVILPGSHHLGKRLRVKITQADIFSVWGEEVVS